MPPFACLCHEAFLVKNGSWRGRRTSDVEVRPRRVRPELRCKIRSYLTPIFSANFADFRQLVRARSRLYRSRFLQPNTHFAALFEIYKNIIPSHRSKFNILTNFHQKVVAIFKISSKSLLFFTIFIGFCTDLDKIFSEFRQIP